MDFEGFLMVSKTVLFGISFCFCFFPSVCALGSGIYGASASEY